MFILRWNPAHKVHVFVKSFLIRIFWSCVFKIIYTTLATRIDVVHNSIVNYFKVGFWNVKSFDEIWRIFLICLKISREKFGKSEDLYFNHLAALFRKVYPFKLRSDDPRMITCISGVTIHAIKILGPMKFFKTER